MTGHKTGDRITVPDPNGDGRVPATFLDPGEPEEIDAPYVVGGKRLYDRAWVRYEDGTTGQHAYSEIEPAG